MTLKPNLFAHAVPPCWDNPHEIKLLVSAKAKIALAAIPRGEEHILEGVIAFDQLTRRWFAVRHFPCFRDCFDCCCAAQAIPVAGKASVHKWEPIEFPEEDEECPHCGR